MRTYAFGDYRSVCPVVNELELEPGSSEIQDKLLAKVHSLHTNQCQVLFKGLFFLEVQLPSIVKL